MSVFYVIIAMSFVAAGVMVPVLHIDDEIVQKKLHANRHPIV